jgi:hypothetical protein
MKGYIKLHRSIIDSAVFTDANLLKTWIWLLGRAVYKPVKLYTANLTLDVGQFATSYRVAARDLETSTGTVKRHFDKLIHMDMITVESGTLFTVVTVCNYKVYQHGEEKSETAVETPVETPVKTRVETPVDTRRRSKEYKERKNNYPTFSTKRKESLARWIDYKRETGNYTEMQVEAFVNSVAHLPDGTLELKITRAIANGWKGLGNYEKEAAPLAPKVLTAEQVDNAIALRELWRELDELKARGEGMSDEAENIKKEMAHYES